MKKTKNRKNNEEQRRTFKLKPNNINIKLDLISSNKKQGFVRNQA
jgi:hypothetical protein